MATLHAAFPSGPLTDESGNLTSAWRGFFQSLYTRTGGAPGESSDTTAIQAGLAAETTARASADVTLTNAIAGERSAREAADAAEANARASADAGKLPLSGGVLTGPLRANGGFGVLGHAAVTTRPVVTGSRGGNVALAALLNTLANYGLIQDSTTA